jgi:PleD family two-component response regulator
MSLKERLEKNYEVHIAQNVKTMLEILDTTELGLLMIDINTPDIDDGGVLDLLQAEIEENEVKIVFLTSDKNRPSILKGKNIGAVDFLLKPFPDQAGFNRMYRALSNPRNRKTRGGEAGSLSDRRGHRNAKVGKLAVKP